MTYLYVAVFHDVFFPLSADESARWDQALAPVIDQWIADNAAKGLPAQEAVDLIRRVVESYGP